MTYYTNNKLKSSGIRKGTATIKINEDITGKYGGEVMKKGSEVVVSDAQYDTLMSVIDDGNCEWDLIVDTTISGWETKRDQFTLSYTKDKTNFSIEAMNC